MNRILAFMGLFILSLSSSAQSGNDILNLLISKGAISQDEADSLRAEASISQQNNLPDKKFRINLELRPRFMYKNGYKQIPNDTTTAAYQVDQRTRLNLSYENDHKLAILVSLQDLRIWGQQDPKSSTPSTFQVYEAWAEPYLNKHLSVRIGRQRLMFDNQRLFAENNWSTSGGSHDALNFRYYSNKINSELAMAWNQSSERTFGTDFSPSGFSFYKFLLVNYFRYQLNDQFVLTALNSADSYQNSRHAEKYNTRFTDGGRIEFTRGSLYLTLGGYYQCGKNNSGTRLRAWYLQPEARGNFLRNTTVRIGAEIFSGNDPDASAETDHSFVPLYGVAHRFNGSLDLIARFPQDVGNAGLVNPYFFLIQNINKKIDARCDIHLFYLKENYVVKDEKLNHYLGWENDWMFTYKPNGFTTLELGYSFAPVTETFEIIKKSGPAVSRQVAQFAYLMITFKPVLFSANFN